MLTDPFYLFLCHHPDHGDSTICVVDESGPSLKIYPAITSEPKDLEHLMSTVRRIKLPKHCTLKCVRLVIAEEIPIPPLDEVLGEQIN